MPALIVPSFAAGELSPSLYGRVDTSKYQIGLRTARNAIVHPQGGVSNRPGTEFIGPCKDHTNGVRLFKFQFKTTDVYVLEFGNLYMRVLRNGGHVLETAVVITAATAANPVVVTAAAHGFSNGDEVYITGVLGMTQLNGKRYKVANVAANTMELTDQVTGANVNGTAYTAYSSAGTVARVYTLTTPYIFADLATLKTVQSADKLTLTHPSYAIRELTRTGHAAWTLTQPTFVPSIAEPTAEVVTVNTAGAVTHRYQVTAIARTTFEESLPGLNTTTRTITGITAANPAVVTSNAHGFSNGDQVHIAAVVGMTELNGRRFICRNVAANTFELEGENSTAYTAYSSAGTANQTFVRITNSAVTTDNTVTWTAVSGAQQYAVYREKNGLFGFCGETETTTFEDDNIAPDVSRTPPQPRNPFRVAGEFPGAAGYYQQRRVFGGSNTAPDTSIYSRTGSYSNFSVSVPTVQDDAITATLPAREVNDIRHFVPLNDLLIFTGGGEWKITAGDNAGFAAETLRQSPQTYWGSSHVPPLVVGDTVLYVRERGSVVQSIGYVLERDGYRGPNMTILSRHLFTGKTLTYWDYAQVPDSIIYAVRSDGEALCLTFEQEQQVVAWTHWDTKDGFFESVVVVPETTAQGTSENVAYFSVKRKKGTDTVRYIERLHSRHFAAVEDCFFVDSGLTYDPAVTISGSTAANPVVITATAHGYANGDEVDISDILWAVNTDADGTDTQPAQLNGGRYVVAGQTANTFQLTGVDGTAYNAYVSGGKVRLAKTSFTGLEHLEGKAVVALANGDVITGLTVSSGAITLARKASRIHVGLAIVADIELLDVEVPGKGAPTLQGSRKKLPSATLRVEKSRGFLMGPSVDKLHEVKQREFETMGTPTALLTGDKRMTFESNWGTNGRIFIRQRYPLPLTVLACIPDIEKGDD